jgi:Sec-independent protein translocase protein TatA
MRHIKKAIRAVRKAADDLEAECPASQAGSPREEAAHELMHALRDAAGIAERAIGVRIR